MINSVAVGVYHTCSSNEVNWIVGNSDSKIVFVGNNPNDNDETEKMPNHRLLAVLDELDKVELVVTMDGVELLENDKIISWDDFIAKGETLEESEVLDRANDIGPDDTSSLIYTSGTTGNPKGVELTHNNWTFELDMAQTVMKFDQGCLLYTSPSPRD